MDAEEHSAAEPQLAPSLRSDGGEGRGEEARWNAQVFLENARTLRIVVQIHNDLQEEDVRLQAGPERMDFHPC